MNLYNFCEEIKVKVHQYSIEYGQFEFSILYNEMNINCQKEETNI